MGLGNVDNESKATMFTSPTFTGTPTAPTAAKTINNTQIATTAHVKLVLADYSLGTHTHSYVSQTTARQSTDLNLNKSQGFYALGGGANNPSSYGALIVANSSSDRFFQLHLGASDGELRFRNGKGSATVWESWNTAWHDGNLRSDAQNDARYIRLADAQTITGAKTFNEFVTSKGFVRQGSNDTYMLLGGGGHKAVSDFVDTTSNQSIGGIKNFTSSIKFSEKWSSTSLSGNALYNDHNNRGFAFGSGTGQSTWFVSDGTVRYGIGIYNDGSQLNLYTNNLNRLHINNSGNIGIGTTSPSQKLDVAGNVKATSFIGKATSAGSADTATK